MTIEYHPLSNIFPMMTPQEYAGLRDDIARSGLLEPIWIYEQKIIDGRNRYQACIELGIDPSFRVYAGSDPVGFVVGLNLHRRHLNDSQRAMVGDNLATLPKGVRSDTAIAVSALTQAQAAKVMHTSIDSIQRARQVRERGTPELVAAVESGHIAVSQAVHLADKPAEFQKEIVSKAQANTNGLNVAQLVKEYDRDQQRAVNTALVQNIHTPLSALSGKNFSTIVIDPPWSAAVSGDIDIMGRSRPTYATMELDEIAALPVGDVAAPNAHIYLWVTNRVLPVAFDLLTQWNFRYVTTLTWCKPSIGMGNYFRGSTEHVLFGVRGNLPLLRKDVGTWFAAPRGNALHSAKPPEFLTLVEGCSPGPWVEIFARSMRQGWASWGAENVS